MQQRGLAGAVGAEDGDDLALGHVEARRRAGRGWRRSAWRGRCTSRSFSAGLCRPGGDLDVAEVGALVPGALVAHAEVGLDDGLVLLDVVGLAVGDALAVVEHGDPVAEAHDQLDVVLDEQHGDAGVADAADAVDQVLALRPRSCRRRARRAAAAAARRRARGRSRPAAAARRAGWPPAGAPRRPGRRGAGRPWRAAARRLLLPALARQAEAAGDEPGLLVPVAADEDVLEHVHVLEDAQVLERARHAQPGAVRRRQLGDVLAAEPDPRPPRRAAAC